MPIPGFQLENRIDEMYRPKGLLSLLMQLKSKHNKRSSFHTSLFISIPVQYVHPVVIWYKLTSQDPPQRGVTHADLLGQMSETCDCQCCRQAALDHPQTMYSR